MPQASTDQIDVIHGRSLLGEPMCLREAEDLRRFYAQPLVDLNDEKAGPGEVLYIHWMWPEVRVTN